MFKGKQNSIRYALGGGLMSMVDNSFGRSHAPFMKHKTKLDK